MWVFMSDAFLSVVDVSDEPSLLMVRARAPGDIERVFPDADVTVGRGADYRYRATVPRELVARTLADAVQKIDYGNFKNSVTDGARHTAYAKVWGAMVDWQEHVRRQIATAQYNAGRRKSEAIVAEHRAARLNVVPGSRSDTATEFTVSAVGLSTDTVVTVARPDHGSPPGSIVFRAPMPDGGAETIHRSVPSQDRASHP